MEKRIVKPNPMMVLASVLLCLVLISTYSTSGLYAKYTGRNASDASARAALWDVSATGGKPALTIDCSTSVLDDSYIFTVTNRSEVSVDYGIAVIFSTPLDAGISLKLDGSAVPTTTDRKEFVFSSVGQLAHSGDLSQHTLTFIASSDDVQDDVSYDFNVRVDFEQID